MVAPKAKNNLFDPSTVLKAKDKIVKKDSETKLDVYAAKEQPLS